MSSTLTCREILGTHLNANGVQARPALAKMLRREIDPRMPILQKSQLKSFDKSRWSINPYNPETGDLVLAPVELISPGTRFLTPNSQIVVVKTESARSLYYIIDDIRIETGGDDLLVSLRDRESYARVASKDFSRLKTLSRETLLQSPSTIGFEKLTFFVAGNERSLPTQFSAGQGVPHRYFGLDFVGEIDGYMIDIAHAYGTFRNETNLDGLSQSTVLFYYRLDTTKGFRKLGLSQVLLEGLIDLSAGGIVLLFGEHAPSVRVETMTTRSYADSYGGTGSSYVHDLRDNPIDKVTFGRRFGFQATSGTLIRTDFVDLNLEYLLLGVLHQLHAQDPKLYLFSERLRPVLEKSPDVDSFLQALEKDPVAKFQAERTLNFGSKPWLDTRVRDAIEGRLTSAESDQLKSMILTVFNSTPAGRMRKKMGLTKHVVKFERVMGIRDTIFVESQ